MIGCFEKRSGYEFQPTVLHAKITVCDSEIVTIGSFNVNNISAYASLELNLDIKHKEFGEYIENQLEKTITENCKQITAENYRSSINIFKRLWQKTCYT
jgi:cardiolipin synthase